MIVKILDDEVISLGLGPLLPSVPWNDVMRRPLLEGNLASEMPSALFSITDTTSSVIISTWIRSLVLQDLCHFVVVSGGSRSKEPAVGIQVSNHELASRFCKDICSPSVLFSVSALARDVCFDPPHMKNNNLGYMFHDGGQEKVRALKRGLFPPANGYSISSIPPSTVPLIHAFSSLSCTSLVHFSKSSVMLTISQNNQEIIHLIIHQPSNFQVLCANPSMPTLSLPTRMPSDVASQFNPSSSSPTYQLFSISDTFMHAEMDYQSPLSNFYPNK